MTSLTFKITQIEERFHPCISKLILPSLMYEVLGKFTKNRDLKSCGDRKTTENTLECAQVEKENIKAYMDSQIEHVGTLSQYQCRL